MSAAPQPQKREEHYRTTTKTDAAAAFAAGAGAGIVSTCVVNPLDTLRVRLAASRDATGQTSKSIVGHIRGLFRSGIADGLTKGLLINLIASTPSNAIYLSAYRFLTYECAALGANDAITPIVSAGGAVLCTNVTLAPLFLLRTRVQIDPSKTFTQYAKHVMMKEGPRGFYRGTMTNIAGRMIEECTFWYLFESMRRITAQGNLGGSSVGARSASGGADGGGSGHTLSQGLGAFAQASFGVLGLSSMAKLFATSISYPYQVVMVHLREVDKATGTHKHVRVLPTINHIYRADGVAGFYKGLTPHLLRSVLSKASQVYCFELAMSLYVAAKMLE